MSAVLPPKKPSRQPIKLSLPVQPSPSSSSSSSSTSPLAAGGAPSTSSSSTTSTSGAFPVASGSGSVSVSGSKPSLKLPSLAGLSLNGPQSHEPSAPSGSTGTGSSGSGASPPRSVGRSGFGIGIGGMDERGDESDAYETDDGETKWAKGDHERITGDILNVIQGGTPAKEEERRLSASALGGPPSGVASPFGGTTRPSTAGSSVSSSTSGHFARRRGDSSNDDEMDIEPDQFDDLGKLGEGTSGTVRKVRHRPTGIVMAKKTIPTSPNPKLHKQHLRELLFMRDCRNIHIVQYYGAFLEDNDTSIGICMEYCEGGSLDGLYRRVKANGWRTGEKVLSKIAESILTGLVYLHSLKIVHRDIKPSNVLVSRDGIVKLCDFGVSGELINSLAGTFVGTTFYLSPERIKGQQYSINSDVWSMGLTVLEVALNRFPFPAEGEAPLNGPIELLTYLSTMGTPEIRDEPENGIKYTKAFRHFIQVCLEKDPAVRPSPQKLLTHAWIRRSIERDPPTSITKWVTDIHNSPEEA